MRIAAPVGCLVFAAAACGSFDEAPDATPEIVASDAGEGGSGADAGVDASDGASAKDGAPLDKVRVVFVTNKQFVGGEIGGIAGAVALCNNIANASTHLAVKGKTFLPWLSDGTVSPALTFTKSTSAYVTPNGAVIATSWTALTDGTLHAGPIDEDENGQPVPSITDIWTGTRIDGTSDANHCSGWTNSTSAFDGANGRALAKDKSWTADKTDGCENNHRFYCFEQ